MRYSICSLGVGFVFAALTAFAQTPKIPPKTTQPNPTQPQPTPAPTPIALPFGPGERLEYNLIALGTNAGRLKIGVIDEGQFEERTLMSLAAKLEPTGFMQLLWQGEARRTSFLDTISLQPRRVIDVEETPDRTWKTQLDFDGKGTVTATRFGAKADGTDVTTKRQVALNTIETLTGLYQLRTRTFTVGEQFSLEILDNGRIYKLDFKVDRKEKLKTVLGEEDAIVVKLEARRVIAKPAKSKPKPQPKAPSTTNVASLSTETPKATSMPASAPAEPPKPADVSAVIWFSNTSDRIPLRIDVDMYKVGSVTAELSNYTPPD